jgi:uncharacterized protein (DUF488 family)
MEIFTIGYEGMTIKDFVQCLLRWKVNVVADVRLNPISRKPFFSKAALIRELASNGIDYMHFKELGAPQSLRTALISTGDYPKFMLEYRKYAAIKVGALNNLLSLVKSKKTALMCLEKDPEKCHRSMIAKMVKEIDGNGMRIRSL